MFGNDCIKMNIKVVDSGLVGSADSGRGTTRAEDAQGTPTESHLSPSMLVYEDNILSNTYDFEPFCASGAISSEFFCGPN